MHSRTNQEWLEQLRSEGAQRDSALADLREILLHGLPYALSRWLPGDDPRFVSLVEETVQETLLRVLDRLETFEGRSQFTTWVQKIAVRIALTELRRKRWENYSLDEIVEGEQGASQAGLLLDRQAEAPESAVEGDDLVQFIRRMITEELTEKQRLAITAVAVQGVPLEEAARRMGTNRNALYKLMHDARLRLKHRLVKEGLTVGDVLAVFAKR